MNMLEVIQVLILGLLEGLTELLPVSSTAHVILFSDLFSVREGVISLGLLQFMAFIPVLFYYFKSIYELIFSNKFERALSILVKILITMVPVVFFSLIFNKYLGALLSYATIALSLIIGGIIMVCLELFYKKDSSISNIAEISYMKALYIGLFQSLAMIPGVSRLGASMVGGRMLGLNRELSVDFAFIIGIPVIPSVFIYELIFKSPTTLENINLSLLLISSSTAILTSALLIKYLIKFLRKSGMLAIGYYRIILGICLIFLY